MGFSDTAADPPTARRSRASIAAACPARSAVMARSRRALVYNPYIICPAPSHNAARLFGGRAAAGRSEASRGEAGLQQPDLQRRG